MTEENLGEVIQKPPIDNQTEQIPSNEVSLQILGADSSNEDIKKITQFYNKYFPLSPHSEKYKIKHYQKEQSHPLNMVAIANGRIIGLLESRMISPTDKVRLLETILIDPEHRGQGLAQQMFQKLFKFIDPGQEIVVHFRDSKKTELEKFYTNLGFVSLQKAGTYKNGETKWEMRFLS